MNVFVVDDEAPARERLKNLLAQLPDTHLIGEADNGYNALQQLQQLEPDVVLLDIRMPYMDGLETAHHLVQIATPPALVFTTAYDDYAIDAFEAKAIAYLLKPVRKENLQKALMTAQSLNRAQIHNLQSEQTITPHHRSHLCAKLGNRFDLIPITEVIFFQAQFKYVTARHQNGEIVIEESLKALAVEFSENFVRVHRNALVAIAHIARLEKNLQGQYFIQFRTISEKVEVSRRHVSAVRKLIRSL